MNESNNRAGENYKMDESVREKLLSISDNFIDFLGVDFFVHDIVLTGSLANFNWSEFSDIDLHIIIDFDESGHNHELLKQFFDAKKNMWNSTHDIKVRNYEVEIYVQDVTEKHVSSGVYSVLNNKWVVEPQREKHKIDDSAILEKGDEYMSLIDNLISKKENGENVKSDIDVVKNKLKRFRQSGLDEGGEYSYENLTFKLLRRNGYIKKLLDLKKDTSSKELSINENPDEIHDGLAKYVDNDGIPFGFYEDNMVIGFNGKLIPQQLYEKIQKEFLDPNLEIYERHIGFLFGRDDYSIHPEIPYFYEMLYRLGVEKKKITFISPPGKTQMHFWRTMYKYAGRLWYQKKIISFWEFPNGKDELLKILYAINSEMKKIYNVTLNFNEYSVEVRVADESVVEYELVPVNEYVGGYINSTEEEISSPHLLPPNEKQKHPQMQAVKMSNMARDGEKEKTWGSMANRNHILNKNVAENKS